MPKTAARLADEIQGIWDAADREGRELDPDERAHMEQLLEHAKSQHRVEKGIREIGLQMGVGGEHVVRSDGSGPRGGSPGEQFAMSKGYQGIADPAGRGQSWSTGLVDCGELTVLHKGTLLEGAGAPGSGTGGGLVPVPQVVPGVVDKLFQPLTFEDLLLSGQATGPSRPLRGRRHRHVGRRGCR